MLTNKIRTAIVVSAVGAALASSGMASAAIVVQKPGTGTPVVASQPPIVAKPIDPGKVGSAGIPGYTNEVCQSLAGLADNYAGIAEGLAAAGGNATAAEQASNAYSNKVEDNCLVQD
jgi:hypothetical protein